ncbi:hypothetical protein EW145_g366 [Phellinidium pouzarii]|uniref:Uncharacterized protein n=1 Tax=Phellinidium pouzarii TaxID=167371 RepID=A0A4S4LIR3_9AGAM|nr:hypothetical protein EW145_g366 [Phellinidium pouzarii]
MSQNLSLPPPIRDPASGKTYVAIRAPPFIFSHEAAGTTISRSSKINTVPGYVYVERNIASSPGRVFTVERSELPNEKPSIDEWMVNHCSAQPPPGHIPWTSEVKLISPVFSNTTQARFQHNTTSSSPIVTHASSSTFEIPSFESGNNILNGSLPSTCSSVWSADVSPPPISTASFQRPISSPSPIACQSILHPSAKGRRYTTCLPDLHSRREALVFERRLTLEKRGKIEDLDAFFSKGLQKMDSTMQHLDEEKVKLEPPSLVLSTSTAVLPLSLESCVDLINVTPPLAVRRGKSIPVALKLDSAHVADSLEYPEVPTAFRGSPAASESFPDVPSYPPLILDSKMTTEQMISSLRFQVKSFLPKRPPLVSAFTDQCADAEKWLEDELASDGDDSEPMDCFTTQAKLDDTSYVENPDWLLAVSTPADSMHQASPKHKNLSGNRVVELPLNSLKSWNAKPRPWNSILSDNVRPALKTGAEKKVRFSHSPPLIIPRNIIGASERKSPRPTAAVGKDVDASPTKRKPPPLVNSIRTPVTRNQYPPTPIKASSLAHKPSPRKPTRQVPMTPCPASPASYMSDKAKLTGRVRSLTTGPTTVNTTLSTPPSLQRRTSELAPPLTSPLGPSGTDNVNADSDLPKRAAHSVDLVSKESLTQALKVAGITFAKRRNPESDKENENHRDSKLVGLVAREAAHHQKKHKDGRTRSLPFQSMLSRFRDSPYDKPLEEMPRGIPNAKKDDLGMRYTTFHVPMLTNPKLTASSYQRSDSQTVWARNATRASKAREDVGAPEGRRGAKVLVIHPGSRWLRIGRAADVVPVSIPHVIARRVRDPPAAPPSSVHNISRPRMRRHTSDAGPADARKDDEYAVTVASDDPASGVFWLLRVDAKIAAITMSLRDRMRFYKLRVVPNASRAAMLFNEQMEGEETKSTDIPQQAPPQDEILVGERVFELSHPPHLEGYTVKWPVYAGRFNTRNYSSHQNMLGDIEEIWKTVIRENLDIDPSTLKEYSVVLVIPDLWERFYVRELVHMLLISMGVKQVVCQQESLAATYGAGISNACVIDLGAVKTSVACVDDGLVLSDTRMSLSLGGDDVTEFLAVLLDRISFPYKEMDLTRLHDWAVMEDIKCRICTLNESDVALNLYDFWVRHPRKNPVKYGLRAYDEVILAPMVTFEPRVVEFDKKREGLRQASHPDITDELVEFVQDQLTSAMLISTQHLIPQVPPPIPGAIPTSAPASGAVTPQHVEVSGSNTKAGGDKTPVVASGVLKKSDSQLEINDVNTVDVEITNITESQPSTQDTQTPSSNQSTHSNAATPTQQIQSQDQTLTPAPLTIVSNASAIAVGSALPVTTPVPPSANVQSAYIGGYPIDVPFEASKLPLDVAIFNSARAAGGDDRIRKYLQGVLIVGGGALTPGMAHALESRLQAIATPLVANMEKVMIIPSPKDVDPRMMVWKGAAVLGKMDSVSDLWVTAADWSALYAEALLMLGY